MRVMQLAHGIYPFRNAGVEVYTYELGKQLMARGHEVVAVVPANGTGREHAEMEVFSLPVPERDYFSCDVNVRDCERISEVFEKFVRHWRPDIIHVQHLIHMGWRALPRLAELNVPFLISLPDYWFLCQRVQRMCGGSWTLCAAKCKGVSPLHRPLAFVKTIAYDCYRRRSILSYLNGSPAPLISISARTAEIYEESGVDKSRVAVQSWGIPLEKYIAPVRDKASGQATAFGFIGALLPIKGAEVLIEAFKKAELNATLDIYGSGNRAYEDKLKSLCAGQPIRFHGAYNHTELPELLADVDVLVVPSLWEEAYGLVVQEALALKKIVIASATGGLANQIEHGINGFLVKVNDVDSLVGQMRYVNEHRHGIAARLDFNKNLRDIADDAERFEQWYAWTIKNWKALCAKAVSVSDFGRIDKVCA